MVAPEPAVLSEYRRSIESLQQVARLAHRLTGAAGVTVSLFDQGTQHVMAAAGAVGAAYVGAQQDAGRSLCTVVVTSGRRLVCDDTHADPDLSRHHAVRDGGVGAYVGFPLRGIDDTVLGSLCAWEAHPRQWGEETVDDLRDLAGNASTQLAFARLARERAESERELRSQRAFDAAVLDSLVEGVVACDENGQLSLFNRALREIHGASEAADVDWASTYQLYSPDGGRLLDPDEVPLARAFAGEDVVDQPMAIGRDGALRQFLATGTQLSDDAGNRIGAVVAMRDVTDDVRRRRFDAAQLDAATRLAQGPSGDGVALVLEVLRHAFRTTDVEFVAAAAPEPDDGADLPRLPTQRRLDDRRAELSVPVRVAGAVAGVLEVRGDADELLDGQSASLGTALGVMLARRLELARLREVSDDLHRTRAELERVIAQVEDFVYSFEVLPDGRVQPILSGSSAGVLGGELGADDWKAFFDTRVPPEDRGVLTAWRSELRAGRAAEMTCRMRGLDGTTRWVWSRAKPRYEGDRLFVDGVSSDVTTRQQLHLDRERLVREQARQVEELKALDAAKSEFVATVAHEIRGPLGVVVTFADHAVEAMDPDGGPLTASMGGGPAAARRSAALTARTAGHLQKVVENLFDLARYDAGALTVQRDDVDLTTLVGDVGQSIAPAAAAAGLTLRVDAGPAPIVLSADATKLRQAVDNVVGNAVKFTPAGGTVTLSCARPDDATVAISIADTGIGVPPEDVPLLFSRFYRASNARTAKTPGTGLGLALARSIAEAHGGGVTIEPNLPNGTIVTLHLPLR